MKITSVLLGVFMLLGCDRAEEEIVIVPRNYTGYIIIVYNQANGADPIYENRKRVYQVPSNGVLKTKFSPNPGWMGFPEFYYEKVAPENRIPFKFDIKTLPADSVVAYGGAAGSINKEATGKEAIKLLTYHIGNKAQIDSTYEQVKKLDILKITE
ncbi:hypothetical protein JHJ32_21420 [Parapedobacter sp. ISTM3]|uniref:DUF6843 domain-containing protein n=1 Tax=Parapedobacter sp. ISTM3 TaxID=2800130 RepID=UPI0019043033|nr:hypothetical protein [Parapedobacter sp. ISTM3]MBK1442574.1 hypothetical protein [Parapedobacter sp. ISTM3]